MPANYSPALVESKYPSRIATPQANNHLRKTAHAYVNKYQADFGPQRWCSPMGCNSVHALVSILQGDFTTLLRSKDLVNQVLHFHYLMALCPGVNDAILNKAFLTSLEGDCKQLKPESIHSFIDLSLKFYKNYALRI